LYSMKICFYCFHTFVILEFLTVQVLSTLSLVVMTSNKVETTRVVAVETRYSFGSVFSSFLVNTHFSLP
jgi:hypothetical protein